MGRSLRLLVSSIVLTTLWATCGEIMNRDKARAVKELSERGHEVISVGGWRPFECRAQDNFSMGFTVLAPTGSILKGVVCCNGPACYITY